NLGPVGRNLEGIGAASLIYFDKPAAQLSGPESVALSVIPQSPARRALSAASDNRSVNLAQSNWYDRTRSDAHNFSGREFRARMQRDGKFLAPHFVQQLLEKSHGRDELVTTLDLEKQQAIERRITDYVAWSRNRGIENAAAMLVDARTMEVLAQVGSA